MANTHTERLGIRANPRAGDNPRGSAYGHRIAGGLLVGYLGIEQITLGTLGQAVSVAKCPLSGSQAASCAVASDVAAGTVLCLVIAQPELVRAHLMKDAELPRIALVARYAGDCSGVVVIQPLPQDACRGIPELVARAETMA